MSYSWFSPVALLGLFQDDTVTLVEMYIGGGGGGCVIEENKLLSIL